MQILFANARLFEPTDGAITEGQLKAGALHRCKP